MVDSGRVRSGLSNLSGRAELLETGFGELERASLQALRDLQVVYQGVAADEGNKFSRGVADSRIDFPPFGYNPPPAVAMQALRPYVAKTYSNGPREPRHPSHNRLLHNLFDRHTERGAKVARRLFKNAAVRAKFEALTGGARVVVDGRSDGTVGLREKPPVTAPTPSSGPSQRQSRSPVAQGSGAQVSAFTSMPTRPPPTRVYDLFNAMDAAVLAQARMLLPGGAGPYMAATLGGLLGSDPPPGGLSTDDEEAEEAGLGTGSFASGSGSGSGSGFERGAPASSGPFGANTYGEDSVDSTVFLVKRLNDRREQMYDLYRQVFTAYNMAAKQVVDAMRG